MRISACPTISMIDVDQILKQVQKVVAQLSMAVESILLLILCAGILVLVASVQASRDERMHESAILRALGTNKALIQKMLLVKFWTALWIHRLEGIHGAPRHDSTSAMAPAFASPPPPPLPT